MPTRKDRETRENESDRSAQRQSTGSRRTRGSPTEKEPQPQNAQPDRERTLSVQREDGTAAARREPSRAALGAASPFETMHRLAATMDRLAQSFGLGRPGLAPLAGAGQDPWSGLPPLERTIWSPQLEIFERGDRLVVRADLPGLERDDVTVEITGDDVLTIAGERREHSEDRDADGFYRSERSYGRFVRRIPLPEGVDASACEATFRNGVLEVTLPAPRQESRGRRIEVRG